MKTNAIIRIAIFFLAILVLLGILLSILVFDMFVVDGKVQFDRDGGIEAAIEMVGQGNVTSDVRNIEIEWVAGSITIQPDASVSEIQITEYCSRESKYQMIYRQSGQTLKIQFCEESIKFPTLVTSVDVSKELFITVPADWTCNKLEIDAASTEVEVCDLKINEVNFDGASGRLNLTNCTISDLDIDTASGDVEFSGVLKELDFDAASAKFFGEFLETPDRLDLDTMSGDLEIILPENCGFTCKLDTMSGDFDSDFEFGSHDGFYIHGDGGCQINVSAMSGDVNILKGIGK